MRSLFFNILILSIQVSTGWAASWPQPVFVKVAEGLDQPVHITHAGDGSGRLFVVEQSGRIKILKDNTVLDTLFLDISERVGSGGERGLLSVAFPPDYRSKGYFYVDYTNNSGSTTVSRFYLGANENLADAQSEEIVLTVEQPFANHNGGQIAFGPDGFLYIGTGDGGGAGDPVGSGQNVGTLLGKMLRIDVESGVKPYAVPDTNPFLTTAGFLPEIWALGLRNPWRFSFDQDTGDLYIADVGQDLFEEINVQRAGSQGGENYGWNTMEGLHCFNSVACDQTGLTTPVFEYSHSLGDVSITGGVVYRGKEFPRMQSVYFFGDFASGRVAGLRWVNNQWDASVLADTNFGISSFGEDGAGRLYLVDIVGSVYRIEDSVRLAQLDFEGLLSQYSPGDRLQVSIQETSPKRSVPTDLWVALQPPDSPLLFFTGNPAEPLAPEPQPFIQQVDGGLIKHSVLDLLIPDGIAKGTYTFYAIYNEAGAEISELSLTLRSNLAKAAISVGD